jgi:outer membrane protein OmpA-like peptidoglycan-associated protein
MIAVTPMQPTRRRSPATCRRWLHRCWLLGTLLLSPPPGQAQGSDATGSAGLPIHELQKTPDGTQVMIANPPSSPILPGTYFEVRRSRPGNPSDSKTNVAIGVVKTIAAHDTYVLAEIVREATAESQYFYPNYPGIMAGDRAFPVNLDIKRNLQMTPTTTLTYHELFIDPKRDPTTFELSEQGKRALQRVARHYGDMRVPLLLIEGYTDPLGPSDANQIESYQRALTIKQYLVRTLKFDDKRLVALGLGETEPVAEPYLPEQDRQARRIILKVKSSTQ